MRAHVTLSAVVSPSGDDVTDEVLLQRHEWKMVRSGIKLSYNLQTQLYVTQSSVL